MGGRGRGNRVGFGGVGSTYDLERFFPVGWLLSETCEVWGVSFLLLLL